MRPFRSSELRKADISDLVRAEKDSLSYDVTEEMVDILQPDVLVVCQTATSTVSHEFAQQMSSSIQTSGQISLLQLRDDKQVIVVRTFHPVYALKFARIRS